MTIYLVVVAWIVFRPSASHASNSVMWMAEVAQGLGAPGWVGPLGFEFVSNVLMFVPLPLLGAQLWPRIRTLGWLGIGFGGTCFIETTQGLFLPGRSPALIDIVANTLGAALGALAVWRFRTLYE